MTSFFPIDKKQNVALCCLVLCSMLSACGGGGSDDGTNATDSTVTQRPTGALEATAGPVPQTVIAVDAGIEQVLEQGVEVSLTSSGLAPLPRSNKALVDVNYSWKQIDGPLVQLSNVHIANPMFKTPFVDITTVLTFALTISSATASSTRNVSVTVNRDSPWGVAPSAALSYNPETWVPAMAEAGVTSVRGFYAPVPPAQDQFAPIAAAGMSGIGILQWSSETPQSFPVNDLEGWRRYVTAQVTRFKGRVRHWEVWNEPPNFTADPSPASYARIVAVAYEAAKAVDPQIQIGLAAKSNHVAYLAEAIAAGAKDKFDFVTLHPYEVAAMLPLGWEGLFMGIVPGVRKMLQAINSSKADVPVWFTELGIPASPTAKGGVGPDGQADALTKIYTMAIAQGVARTFWFDPRDSEGLSMGLTQTDGSKRPAFHALRSLRNHLGQRPSYIGWVQPSNAYYGFVFRNGTNMAMVAWSRLAQSTTPSMASEVVKVDPRTGNSTTTRWPVITEAPVILVAPIESNQARQWLREAAVNTTKAFPWNGDHSKSSSVEWVAGKLPNGVFMAHPAEITVVDDVPEFNVAGRSGVTFAIDPTFVSYTTTPIRITAVVRGHGTGDPGFNLKYESDAPVASTDGNGLVGTNAGWFQIKGTALYEKTWVIPNARFIGKYGFNFTFDTDGPSHSQFSIARVTVSR